jgi:hypothetical protein
MRSCCREAGDILHTDVELNRSAEWVTGIDFTDATAAAARVVAEFGRWAPEPDFAVLVSPWALTERQT